ncbi:hypothetical protein D3C84_1034520 [compost metagenome]
MNEFYFCFFSPYRLPGHHANAGLRNAIVETAVNADLSKEDPALRRDLRRRGWPDPDHRWFACDVF